MLYSTLMDHAGHRVEIELRGDSGAVALDCEDCETMLILERGDN
jgi:hypothetical protein